MKLVQISKNTKLAVYLILTLLAGCATTRLQPAKTFVTLDFLEDGKTSKQMVISELGLPSGTPDGGRIFWYRIGSEKNGVYFLLRYWNVRTTKTKFNLVLIFDENNVLQKHSLNPYADK